MMTTVAAMHLNYNMESHEPQAESVQIIWEVFGST